MRLYFAGFYEHGAHKTMSPEFVKNTHVLGSYFYLSKKAVRRNFDPTSSRDFLLDCGAFSFIYGSNTEGAINGLNWKEYIRGYAEFVREFKIKKYFELDIDSIVGYDRVVQYRHMLEDLVGWPCMPIYHKGRTDEQFVEDCQGHPYVAYGTNVGEGTKNNPNVARIADLAHEQGCKIHLLGISNPMPLKKQGIIVDSCDATTWIMSPIYGRRLGWEPGDDDLNQYLIKKTDQLPGKKEKAYSLALWRRMSKWMSQNIEIIWDEDLNWPDIDEDKMTQAELLERYRNISVK